MPLSIFIDSDVLISSIISQSGAAYLLLNETDSRFYTSNLAYKELKTVVQKLKLEPKKLSSAIKNFELIKLPTDTTKLKSDFTEYTETSQTSNVYYSSIAAKTHTFHTEIDRSQRCGNRLSNRFYFIPF